MSKILELQEKIKQLLNQEEYKDIDSVFMLIDEQAKEEDPSGFLIAGTMCIVCASELMDKFIENNHITHDAGNEKNQKLGVH